MEFNLIIKIFVICMICIISISSIISIITDNELLGDIFTRICGIGFVTVIIFWLYYTWNQNLWNQNFDINEDTYNIEETQTEIQQSNIPTSIIISGEN